MKVIEFPKEPAEDQTVIEITFNDLTLLRLEIIGAEVDGQVLNVVETDGSLHFIPIRNIYRAFVYDDVLEVNE